MDITKEEIMLRLRTDLVIMQNIVRMVDYEKRLRWEDYNAVVADADSLARSLKRYEYLGAFQ